MMSQLTSTTRGLIVFVFLLVSLKNIHRCAAFITSSSNFQNTAYPLSNTRRRQQAVKQHYHQAQQQPDESLQEPSSSSSSSRSDQLRREAEELLAKAQALRDDIPETRQGPSPKTKNAPPPSRNNAIIAEPAGGRPIQSPWTVSATKDEFEDEDDGESFSFVDYRLYVDIGREEGTWMDPRWGASGKRIEFTLDVRFVAGESPNALADPLTAKEMVQDNFGGQSSRVYRLLSAENARLRQGFDQMKCHGGAYRVDNNNKNGSSSSSTIRFYVNVNGTSSSSSSSSYGDVSIPAGNLYFSLPAFGPPTAVLSQLSRKEGPVTVRQMGWHTGWRREESRIVGVFKAVPIAEAQRRDGF